MMNSETEMDFKEGIRAVDGINFKISSQRMTFLFLTKVIDSKTLNIMLTDSADNFWIGDFDAAKINTIRQAMKLQGSYKEYFSTMANMLKTNHYEIEVGRNSDLDLVVEFHLQGIVISSRFNIGRPFKRDENSQIYYQLLKAFVLDLYNAQQAEKSAIEEENIQLKAELNSFKEQIEDGRLIKSQAPSAIGSRSVEMNPAAQKRIKPKTSIFNPQMRKRKGIGAKIIEEN